MESFSAWRPSDQQFKTWADLRTKSNDKIARDTLFRLDETNFNIFCKWKERRSKTGNRTTAVLLSSKGAQLHCIRAMTSSHLVKFTTRRGGFNAEDFKEWIVQLVDDCVRKWNSLPILIIDNAPAHSRAEPLVDIEEIATGKSVEILRLGPYS